MKISLFLFLHMVMEDSRHISFFEQSLMLVFSRTIYSKIFQTLYDCNLAWDLHFHFRFDDLYFRTSLALPRSDGQGLEKLLQMRDTRSGTAEKTQSTSIT